MRDITIYECGAMSYFYNSGEYDKATRWRDYAHNLLNDNGIKVFDPTHNSKDHFEHPEKCKPGVIYQNLTYLKKCDVILANLEMIDDSVGSVWEMSLAWADNKPIIAFGECEKWKDRPHFHSLITVQFETVEEACDYIISMYSQKL